MPNLPKELVCPSALIYRIMKEEFWGLQIPNKGSKTSWQMIVN